MGLFIPQNKLHHLKRYRYSSADGSLLGRLCLQAYWGRVAGAVPRCVHPNLLTLAGFAAGMAAPAALLGLQVRWGRGAGPVGAGAPAGLFAWAALGLFAYQTLDAVDGKQARRTGAQGPVGELLDHGCDVLQLPFLMCLLFASLQTRPAAFAVATGVQAAAAVLLIWQQYCTHHLVFGKISFATEGGIAMVLLLAFTSIVTPSYWSTHVVPGWNGANRHVELFNYLYPYLSVLLSDEHIMGISKGLLSLLYSDIMCIATITLGVAFGLSILYDFLKQSIFSPGKDCIVWKIKGLDAVKPIICVPLVILGYMVFALKFEIAHHLSLYFLEISLGIYSAYIATTLNYSRLTHLPVNALNKMTIANLLVIWLLNIAGIVYTGNTSNTEQLHYFSVVAALCIISMSIINTVTYIYMLTAVIFQCARYLGQPLLILPKI